MKSMSTDFYRSLGKNSESFFQFVVTYVFWNTFNICVIQEKEYIALYFIYTDEYCGCTTPRTMLEGTGTWALWSNRTLLVTLLQYHTFFINSHNCLFLSSRWSESDSQALLRCVLKQLDKVLLRSTNVKRCRPTGCPTIEYTMHQDVTKHGCQIPQLFLPFQSN